MGRQDTVTAEGCCKIFSLLTRVGRLGGQLRSHDVFQALQSAGQLGAGAVPRATIYSYYILDM